MQLQSKKVLHITPHLGGGVGKALSGILEWSNSNLSHKILLLEEPENFQFADICTKNGVEITILKDTIELQQEIMNVDVVVIHWWHHPLTAKLLADFPSLETRIILWSHVNGCTYPMLPFELVNSVHKVFLTSKFTFENPYWNEKERQLVKEKASLVYGLGKLKKIDKQLHPKNNDFIIGYVGTLNFSKLNPDFVEYCNEIVKLIPEARFILVGNPDKKETILEQAKILRIHDKFEFTGYINDIYSQLQRFHAFGYPLNSWHFGTTENSVLEAINAFIPVVMLNQCSEKYLIKHNSTGFLADNKEHYAQIMKMIHDNPILVKKITRNAFRSLNKEFSFERNTKVMCNEINNVINSKKTIFEFKHILGIEPYEWFLSCLGADRTIFEKSLNEKNMEVETEIQNCKEILKGKSKSSINHFLKYFKNDNNLQYWNNIIQNKGTINAKIFEY